ncbi:MAG: TetR/AcrR family transcriptional regulator [Hyphomonadaceae bacterium]|nr:TetR/AcrR family transcriptional regulator [Hyphomonadaceae bacterium]
MAKIKSGAARAPARRDAQGSAKREAILEAAKRLFLLEPYDRVSMDAIAAAADVSKVTIYAHFDSKEGLFIAAMGAGCLALFDAAAIDAKRSGDLQAALADLGFRFVENITSPDVSALHGVMIAENQRGGGLTQMFYDAMVARSIETLAALLAQAAAEGKLDCPDPRCAAVQFIAMVQGDFFYRHQLGLDGPSKAALRRYAQDCARVFVRGYRPG